MVLDMLISPATIPIAFSPSISGLGGTWERVDAAGDLYATMQRWRCQLPAGASGTVDVTWAGTVADILWSLVEITGQTQGNNGADAFVQTARDSSNSVTLAGFVSGNECLASWASFFAPDPLGSPDATMVQDGTAAILDTGARWALVTAHGPAEGDNAYSITWAGAYVARAVASEISVNSTISGSAAIAEASDTLAASGALTIAGSGAITEAADSIAAAGAVAISGIGAIVEDADTTTGAGLNTSAVVTGRTAIRLQVLSADVAIVSVTGSLSHLQPSADATITQTI